MGGENKKDENRKSSKKRKSCLVCCSHAADFIYGRRQRLRVFPCESVWGRAGDCGYGRIPVYAVADVFQLDGSGVPSGGKERILESGYGAHPCCGRVCYLSDFISYEFILMEQLKYMCYV